MHPLLRVEQAPHAAVTPPVLPEAELGLDLLPFSSFMDLPQQLPQVPLALPVDLTEGSGEIVLDAEETKVSAPFALTAELPKQSGSVAEPVLLEIGKTTGNLPASGQRGHAALPEMPHDRLQRPLPASVTGEIPGQQKAEQPKQQQQRAIGLSVAQSMIEGRIADLPKSTVPAQTMQIPALKPPGDHAQVTDLPDVARGAVENTPPKASAQIQMAEPAIAKQMARETVKETRDAVREMRESLLPTLQGTPLKSTLPAQAATTGKQIAAVMAQNQSILSHDKGEAVPKAAEIEPLQGLTGQDRASVVSTSGPATTAAAPETARHAAQQLANAIVQSNGKSTEIALNPEELGRVRLSLTAADGALTLVVLSDRPETQELLRRHIEVLAQEFRSLGYDTLSFSFGREGGASAAEHNETPDEDLVVEDLQVTTESGSMKPTTAAGLDLRL